MMKELRFNTHFNRHSIRNIWVTNDNGLKYIFIPLVVIIIRSLPRSWLITVFVTRIMRRLPHVDKRILNRPGAHVFTPCFWWGWYCVIFSVLCNVCRSLFVILSFFSCVVCSSIDVFWSLCYLQTVLMTYISITVCHYKLSSLFSIRIDSLRSYSYSV